MSLSRAFLVSVMLVASLCVLLSAVSADSSSCTYTLYPEGSCTGKPVSGPTTLSGLKSNSQCVQSADGVSSQSIFYNGPEPAWNISSSYFQTSNSCDGPITYSFYPSETVSNCTMTRLTVAPTSDRQSQQLLFINTWIAANCSTVSDEEEEQVTQQRNNNKNSILSLLNAQS